jgi:serine/threonine protein kinase
MSIEDLTGTVVRKICTACSREFAGSGGVCPHDGNMLIPLPQDPYVGRIIADKYHVISVLGTGAMGVVYLARHDTLQSNVALKMLRAQFVGDTASVKRFTREAIATRRLNHPHVITTYDQGFTPQGQPYIVMECLRGKSLADDIKGLKQISVERVIHIFSQACDALDHAHKQGIIHRDLKPGNIMLINYEDDPDYVKVVDFGVAKVMPSTAGAEAQSLTQVGEVCGSPVYMSPEQCLGRDLDRRADVYSMGVVIYEALTGKMPFLGRNMMETMGMHINSPPPPFKDVRPDLYIPEKVEQAVMRALSKRVEDRQPSMAILKQDLTFAVPHPGQNPNLRSMAIASSTFGAEQGVTKALWVLPAIAAAVAALLVAGAAIFYFAQKQAPQAVQTPAKPPVTQPVPVNPAATTAVTANPATATPVAGQAPLKPAAATQTVPAESSTSTVSGPPATTPVEPLTRPVATSAEAEKPVQKLVPARKLPKVAAAGKSKRTATAAASSKPRTAPSSDPFAALSRERTYKVNN